MSEHDEGERGPSGERARVKRPFSWKRYLTFLAVGVVVALFAYLFAVAFLPRWWSQRIADQVSGKMGAGIGWGLFYGIVFTFVPLLVARQAVRSVSWRTRGIMIAVAVVLAAPNWLTLGVVVGNGKGAHAGERIMDVQAPGFRAATLFGAIGAAVVALGLFALMAAGRRDRRRLKQLKSQPNAEQHNTQRHPDQDDDAQPAG